MSRIARLLIAPAVTITAATAPAQSLRDPHPADSTTVVFVCEHGSVKSLVAKSIFNSEAKRRGLPLRAISRGTHPDSAVPAPIRDGLRRDGLDVSAFVPTLFRRTDVRGASLLVSFDQDVELLVDGALPIERWDGLPALSENFPIGRDSIRARIEKLLDRLAASRATRRTPKR